jgi:hydrogenase nickel incorporation protein HypA/HybF
MHELAFAQRIIETAVALLPPEATGVAVLHVQLGALAGVSKDELAFGFEAMSPATPCAGATLLIDEVPAVVHCPQCGIDFTVANSDELVCPTCGTPSVVVIQGKETIISSLEITVDSDETVGQTASEEVVHG